MTDAVHSENSPTTNQASPTDKIQRSNNVMSKDEKRRAIKELLRLKLGITSLNEVPLGQKLVFDNIPAPPGSDSVI